jgi:hypothetical protein
MAPYLTLEEADESDALAVLGYFGDVERSGNGSRRRCCLL